MSSVIEGVASWLMWFSMLAWLAFLHVGCWLMVGLLSVAIVALYLTIQWAQA